MEVLISLVSDNRISGNGLKLHGVKFKLGIHGECGQALEQTLQGSLWGLKPFSVQMVLRQLSYIFGLTFKYTFVESGVLLVDPCESFICQSFMPWDMIL